MANHNGNQTRNRYQALIELVFFERYQSGQIAVSFERDDPPLTSLKLSIQLPKNLGDVVYSIEIYSYSH